MPAIVYDAGALLAAERRNPDFIALHDELASARIRPLVPVVVLARAWRGGPQHQISRVLKGCDLLPDDGHTGRAAGVAYLTIARPDRQPSRTLRRTSPWPLRPATGLHLAQTPRRYPGQAHSVLTPPGNERAPS